MRGEFNGFFILKQIKKPKEDQEEMYGETREVVECFS